MNQFGGNWTEQKMDIVVSYATAYLNVMKGQPWAETMYFDGFAGSGSIGDEDSNIPGNTFDLWGECNEEAKKGTALRILDIVKPKPFDMYYFVEKNESHQRELKELVQAKYPGRRAYIKKGDCNEKMIHLSKYLFKNSKFTALAFIDPYGMCVKWSSIEALKGLKVDLWILVPTGVGANRVLVNDGEIPESWLFKLESFLGLRRSEIMNRFYKEVKVNTLFDGEVTFIEKERDTVNKLGKLYSERLKEVFKYVSEPFVLRNKMNSIMYHFMMATNNTTALRIANDVIRPKYKL